MPGAGVYEIDSLESDGRELTVTPETQKTGWKINKSSVTVDDTSILHKHLTNPPVDRIDLRTPLETKITASNPKGVTIKNALDAIYKAYKDTSDEDLDEPYLAGFEWDNQESWTELIVHLRSTPASN
ncbi:WD repeat containing protein [Fusarium sp. NRRL 25303]|nr:WD repeat containing protein [Fusarium sp. NRRL 25303]